MPLNRQYKNSIWAMTRFRELGLKTRVGDMGAMHKNMYSVMGIEIHKHFCMERGGVFNLEFSKDGKLLVMACQDNALLIYDSFNQRSIARLFDAHNKSVNCIKYINHHTFASGSDDGLVKLWDTRNLSRCKQKFSGHSNCVMSIDYSEHEKMLISSSLHGSVMGWNINRPIAKSSRKLFVMKGLLRTKLSPDSTKMAVATRNGYVLLVHDLIIEKLEDDFNTFQPNVYRLMQESNQIIPVAMMYNHLFSQERKWNRVEFISDFPQEIETINSIQIHPKGLCALSRSTSQYDKEECTTVHDIHTRDKKDYASASKNVQEEAEPKCPEPTSNTESEITTNLPRMTHFIEELTVGQGFIKEPCFSPDGRIMCSPFGNGIRLFSFNKKVQELNLCLPKRPKKLHTLNLINNFHDDYVVCCQFNPINNYQLVTGCLSGQIVWYSPML